MIKNLKIKITYYSFLNILTIISLIIYSNTNNLLETNLSRIANSSLRGYLFLNGWSILFGICLYILLKKMNIKKLAYFGLISALIGTVTPYNYLNVNAFTSNLHLLLAYVSFGLVSLIEIVVLFSFKVYSFKQENILRNIYIIIFGICLYLFLDKGYVCTLCEMIYLSYVLISQLFIYNKVRS